MRPEVKYRLIERIIQMEDETVLNQIQEILEGSELTEAHKKILDDRLAAHKADPESGDDWANVKDRIRKKI